jgi:hypothetical protein
MTRSLRVAAILSLGPPVLAIVIAFVLLALLFGQSKTEFDKAAIDQDFYEIVWTEFEGRRIHCSDVADAAICLTAQQARGTKPVFLWLGNSQLHAIGRAAPGQPLLAGETSSTGVLAALLAKDHKDLLTFSLPNANAQEQYVQFEYLRSRLNIETLVLPLVFLNFRDTGLRDGVAVALRDGPTQSALEKTKIGRRLLDESKPAESSDTGGIAGSPQKWVEDRLNEAMAAVIPAWSLREEARGQIILGLDRIRRTVFATTSTSKRRIVLAAYGPNMDAVQAIMEIARANNIRVVPYLAPIRNDVERPFTTADYQRFVADLRAIMARQDTPLLDFSELIPGRYWGQRPATQLGSAGEIDFLHFQAPGHALLGRKLYDVLSDASGR